MTKPLAKTSRTLLEELHARLPEVGQLVAKDAEHERFRERDRITLHLAVRTNDRLMDENAALRRIIARMMRERLAHVVTSGFVGVVDGKPKFAKQSDEVGDLAAIDIYRTEADALSRWHHVRKAIVLVEPTPIPAPAGWGKL